MITEIYENYDVTEDYTCPNCGHDEFEMFGAKTLINLRENRIRHYCDEFYKLIPTIITCVLCGRQLQKLERSR